jgi:hypothetical protein
MDVGIDDERDWVVALAEPIYPGGLRVASRAATIGWRRGLSTSIPFRPGLFCPGNDGVRLPTLVAP